jgi:hypothetical protein
MGTWGPGVFADDFASDVRGDWREVLEDGVDAAEATRRLITKYHADVDAPDDDDGPIFWFALAAAQAATGRLQPDVANKALALIDAGGDVARFARDGGERLGRQRAAKLEELARTLRGPQRSPTAIKRPALRVSPMAVGDLVRVRTTAHRIIDAYFIAVAIGEAWPKGSTAPILVQLDWDADGPPTAAEASAGRLVTRRWGPPGVETHHVQGPTRGKNAFANFAEVISSGIARPDVAAEAPGGRGWIYTVWVGLARETGYWASTRRPPEGWTFSVAETAPLTWVAVGDDEAGARVERHLAGANKGDEVLRRAWSAAWDVVTAAGGSGSSSADDASPLAPREARDRPVGQRMNARTHAGLVDRLRARITRPKDRNDSQE